MGVAGGRKRARSTMPEIGEDTQGELRNTKTLKGGRGQPVKYEKRAEKKWVG